PTWDKASTTSTSDAALSEQHQPIEFEDWRGQPRASLAHCSAKRLNGRLSVQCTIPQLCDTMEIENGSVQDSRWQGSQECNRRFRQGRVYLQRKDSSACIFRDQPRGRAP